VVKAMESNEEDAKHRFLLKLFLLGFVLVFLGVVVLVITAWLRGDANVSGGVIIIIGFIPIIVGAGPHSFIAILIATILMIISFLVFVWMRKQVSKG
jgi:uncharacterized membrane protein